MENIYPPNGDLTSGDHIPYWIESVTPLAFTSLEHPAQTDVLVIGGGIAGLSTAYCLVKKGKK